MTNVEYLSGVADNELALRSGGGDKGALDYLINKFMPLVRHIAKAYYIPGADREDLLQEGLIGLYRAVIGFDPAQSGFRAFAALCVEKQIITAVKGARRGKHAPLNSYETLTNDCGTADGSPEDIVIVKESVAALEDTMSKRLSPFEKRALLLFLRGCGYREIAEHTGRPVKSVDNALQRVRRKLGNH